MTRRATLPAFNELHRELNRLFENVSDTNEDSRSNWTPRTDVIEFEDRFELRLDLPGVARENVNISFEGETLEIKGERVDEDKPKSRAYYRCECVSGPFSRKFRFPSLISASEITAKMENGVLIVAVPKAEEAKARTIEVR
jgi:HSP20 family protein